LGRSSRPFTEWQRLCDAGRTRRSMRSFRELWNEENAETEDAEFHDALRPDGHDHKIRSAYLLAAVLAGTFCMALGAFYFT